MYLWQRPEWPALTWDDQSLSPLLARVSRKQGRLLGKMEALLKAKGVTPPEKA